MPQTYLFSWRYLIEKKNLLIAGMRAQLEPNLPARLDPARIYIYSPGEEANANEDKPRDAEVPNQRVTGAGVRCGKALTAGTGIHTYILESSSLATYKSTQINLSKYMIDVF